MARFRILPTELKFFELFNRSAENVLQAARLLHAWLGDYKESETRLAQLTELEHQGDRIVHEILDLLSRTFLTPLEGDEIRSLASSLDDVVDHIEAAAAAFVLYQVEPPIAEVTHLAALLLQMAEQIARAVPKLADKQCYSDVLQAAVEIHRLENEADGVNYIALGRLVKERGEWFELFRWKEIIDLMEKAADSCEDVADVLGIVVQKNA
jgi:predicted phosphate transport protein (TIGR00153 family)